MIAPLPRISWGLFGLGVVAVAGIGIPSSTRTVSAPSVGTWALTQLDLDVYVDADSEALRIEGDASLRLVDGSAEELLLIMLAPGAFESVKGPAGAEVVLFDTTVRGDRQVAGARLTFAERRAEHTTVHVAFEVTNAAGAFQVAVSETAALASWVARWYPADTVDVAAPGVTRLNVPEGWRALSNGKLASTEVQGGRRIETWETTAEVARSFVAGPYRVERVDIGGRQVGAYVLEGHADLAIPIARGLAGTLEALEPRFGAYPYDAYAVAEIPNDLVEWFGSSEQGFFMAKSAAFDAPGGVNLPLFAHELGHGWWGNHVRSRGESGTQLLSESLAQYGAVIAIEAIEGAPAAVEFLRFSRQGYSPWQSAKGFFGIWRDGNDTPLAKLTNGTHHHNLADSKGHWFYHMLRRRVGDEVFFGTLRGLIDTYGGSRMSLDDLREAFLSATDDRDGMRRFLAQWLDRPGAPILDADVVSHTNGVATVRVVQHTEPYALDLELGLVVGSDTVYHHVALTGSEQRFGLPSTVRPDTILIDPRHQLLTWQPDYGDRPAESGGD